MANKEHLRRLAQGLQKWNAWRLESKYSPVDLSGADLTTIDLSNFQLMRANLSKVDLYGANLGQANLRSAKLSSANLSEVGLIGADLSGANLSHADLHYANLTSADLSDAYLIDANLGHANLTNANLNGAKLSGANMGGAALFETIIANVDLSNVSGLEECHHRGPSVLDHRTLQKSNQLPLAFLRGAGLPDKLISYLPSLFTQSIQYYSCFISYSTKDEQFANRIHADLQNKGVRCWFAPHDLPVGAKILDAIDTAIRLRDKVLLILSKNSIASDWVEDEVKKALEEERMRTPKQILLFPIRIDNAVMNTTEAWAGLLRRDRNIGDFRLWKQHDAYQASFERALRDLTASPKIS
jgi:hypothetical protein